MQQSMLFLTDSVQSPTNWQSWGFHPLASKRVRFEIAGLKIIDVSAHVSISHSFPKAPTLQYRFSGVPGTPEAPAQDGVINLVVASPNYAAIIQNISNARHGQVRNLGDGRYHYTYAFDLFLRLEATFQVPFPFVGMVKTNAKLPVHFGQLGYNIIWQFSKTGGIATVSYTYLPAEEGSSIEFVKGDGAKISDQELTEILGDPGGWESSG